MILGKSEIERLIKSENLITNLPTDFKIEGATVDFRLNDVQIHLGGAKLYTDKRNTGNLADVKHDSSGIYKIHPQKSYIINTIEHVNIPEDILIYFSRRSTIFRSGGNIIGTFANPGYRGPLTFEFVNFSPTPIEIQKGFRIMQCAFFRVEGDVIPYDGNWQNGEKMGTYGEFDPPR